MKRATLQHDASVTDALSYAGYRFPPEVIGYAMWLYYRFPLSLRMVEELLAARGIKHGTALVGEVWSGHCPAYSFYRIGPRRPVAP